MYVSQFFPLRLWRRVMVEYLVLLWGSNTRCQMQILAQNLIFETASLIDKWQWHFWIFDTKTNYTHTHLFRTKHCRTMQQAFPKCHQNINFIPFCQFKNDFWVSAPILSHPSTRMMIMAMAKCLKEEVRARVRRPKYQNEDDCDENEEKFYVKNTFGDDGGD